jgi:hypothetical protein
MLSFCIQCPFSLAAPRVKKCAMINPTVDAASTHNLLYKLQFLSQLYDAAFPLIALSS